MRGYFKKLLSAASVLCWIAALAAPSCTDVDDSLGQEFIPGDEQMQVETRTVSGIKTYVTLYDSIVSSNLGYAYIGRAHDETFGTTATAALVQMLPYSLPDSMSDMGFRPTVDSVKLRLLMRSWGGDTLTSQTVNVYEVRERLVSDTTFYTDFPYENYIDPEPLFTFELKGRPNPDDYTQYVYTDFTPRQKEYVQAMVECDSATYHNDTTFVNKFKGLVFAPAAESPENAAIYRIDLQYAFFSVFAHNYWEEAPATRKDTVSLHLSFEDRTILARNSLSVNSVRHDYAGSQVTAVNDTVNPATPVFVQGMGGVTTMLEFPDALISEIRALLPSPEYDMVINRARLVMPLTGGPEPSVETLDEAPPRLGSYTDYAGKVSISDYNYTYEHEYSQQLPYGGYLNRSHGYYEMDITSFVQKALLDSDAPRRFVAGPDAYSFFRYDQVALEGYGSTVPPRLELIYTIVK